MAAVAVTMSMISGSAWLLNAFRHDARVLAIGCDLSADVADEHSPMRTCGLTDGLIFRCFGVQIHLVVLLLFVL